MVFMDLDRFYDDLPFLNTWDRWGRDRDFKRQMRTASRSKSAAWGKFEIYEITQAGQGSFTASFLLCLSGYKSRRELNAGSWPVVVYFSHQIVDETDLSKVIWGIAV